MNTAATEATLPQLDDLRPEMLMSAATQATGLDDFGDGFREGMDIFLEDLRTQVGLNSRGVATQFQNIVRILSNRLRMHRDLVRHPEILDDPIESPIIIAGLARTGTSNLQRLIGADPGTQRLETWRVLFPAPFSDSDGANPDPRIAVVEQIEAMMKAQYPDLMARHSMDTREPDEDWLLMELTFESSMPSLGLYAPGHRAWLERRSLSAGFQHLYKVLQYLQWQDGGARGRPWVIKSPSHVGDMAWLLEAFPDATVVHCHRDPRPAIVSFCSLAEQNRLMYCDPDKVDLQRLGAEALTFWRRQILLNLEARRKLGEDRIVDVYFDDICNDSGRVVDEIYARAGRTITPETRQAFADYEVRFPRHRLGKYEYAGARYGLTDERIDAAFAEYLTKFPKLGN